MWMETSCICALDNKYSLKGALGQIAGTKSITQNKNIDNERRKQKENIFKWMEVAEIFDNKLKEFIIKNLN